MSDDQPIPASAPAPAAESLPRTPYSIRAWHLCISGFTQGLGKRTGSHTLWMALNQNYSDPNTAVLPFCWRSPWRDIAEWISVSSSEYPAPKIFVYAYSWGAGFGFVQLARQLRKRGLGIETAVLCDPVYKNPLWSLAWMSLVHQCFDLAIPIPPNVKRVLHFYQRQDLPRGARLKAESPQFTEIEKGRQLDRNHSWMSESPEYQAACKRVARESRDLT